MERIDTEDYHVKEFDHLLRAPVHDKGSVDPNISSDMNHYANLSIGKYHEVIRIGTYSIQYIRINGVVVTKEDPVFLERQQTWELSKPIKLRMTECSV